MYNLRMVPEENLGHRVVPLKRGSVMCEDAACTNEAEYLVRQGTARVRAVCERHLKGMGITEAEIPPRGA
jgi:hypothetical protein